ncbi:hypothetical protein SS05631_c02270 [Sinorhizobium sp. CCBAU 05631]|nr:hypothetical protein SS05631_c02270 [Sinorhizobium sp. CCBAU 05631]
MVAQRRGWVSRSQMMMVGLFPLPDPPAAFALRTADPKSAWLRIRC